MDMTPTASGGNPTDGRESQDQKISGVEHTLEFGLQLAEAVARGRGRRVLVICRPESIGDWYRLLSRSFMVKATVDTPRLRMARYMFWSDDCDVVVGVQLIRPRDEEWQALIKGERWDVLIVHDGHRGMGSVEFAQVHAYG